MTHFFRILQTDIDTKGDVLVKQVNDVNNGKQSAEFFVLSPNLFGQIAGSPFAYWVEQKIHDLFVSLPSFDPAFAHVRTGLQSLGADDIFIRAWWEIEARRLGASERWVNFAKGGASSAWFGDVHLVTDWENNGATQKAFAVTKYRTLTRKITGLSYYYRPGLTYTAYTNIGFRVRALPANCIFSLAGPGIFPTTSGSSLWILGLLNSTTADYCLRLMTDRRKWEPGYIKKLPVKEPPNQIAAAMAAKAEECFMLTRRLYYDVDTTHVFCLPMLVRHSRESLATALEREQIATSVTKQQISAGQAEISQIVLELYGLAPEDIAKENPSPTADEEDDEAVLEDETEVEDDIGLVIGLDIAVYDLLMWCVGCVFGRWDVRFALDQGLLPKLQGPFDALPRCSPSMLVGVDGLPAKPGGIVSPAWLRARPDVITLPPTDTIAQSTILDKDYPVPIAWDGLLPEDELLRRMRIVLQLVWGDRAEAIEQEACQALNISNLDGYFRHPKRFFDFHIKRYSKSKRKAPIYWLLQSKARSYGLWLYYPRLNPDTLFLAGRNYVDPRVNLESNRLAELEGSLADLAGAARKARDREIAAQAELVTELKTFQKTLDHAALLNLKPDLNDGVLLNIAPLRELVPWKEARIAWDELLKGKYAWSSISQQLRAAGIVRAQ